MLENVSEVFSYENMKLAIYCSIPINKSRGSGPNSISVRSVTNHGSCRVATAFGCITGLESVPWNRMLIKSNSYSATRYWCWDNCRPFRFYPSPRSVMVSPRSLARPATLEWPSTFHWHSLPRHCRYRSPLRWTVWPCRLSHTYQAQPAQWTRHDDGADCRACHIGSSVVAICIRGIYRTRKCDEYRKAKQTTVCSLPNPIFHNSFTLTCTYIILV